MVRFVISESSRQVGREVGTSISDPHIPRTVVQTFLSVTFDGVHKIFTMMLLLQLIRGDNHTKKISDLLVSNSALS